MTNREIGEIPTTLSRLSSLICKNPTSGKLDKLSHLTYFSIRFRKQTTI